MTIETVTRDLRRRMEGGLEALRKEFTGLRTGRASPGLLDPVMVEAYGSSMPLSQCGNISVPEPRMLTVQVWDRALVKAVEKAIRDAGLGLNPQGDGQTIRVPIPDLNEERRRELVRIAAKYTEQARIAVRNVRRDGIDALKRLEKDGEITQDDQRRVEKEVQALTDDFIRRIDEAFAQKDREITQV